ncbi:MAG: hypothetical protein H6R03_1858 [Burkholderiaceae bacterium]|nr:hypothetical protein [Burkholderiaceae bacterium]
MGTPPTAAAPAPAALACAGSGAKRCARRCSSSTSSSGSDGRLGGVLRLRGEHLDHAAVADEDLRRVGGGPLDPEAELVHLAGRVHLPEEAAEQAADHRLRQVGAVLRPGRLDNAGLRVFTLDLQADGRQELPHHVVGLLRRHVDGEPALGALAFDAGIRHDRGDGQHRAAARLAAARRRGGRTRRHAGGCAGAVRHREAVVARQLRQVGRDLQRARRRRALVFDPVGRQVRRAAAGDQAGKGERCHGDEGLGRHLVAHYSRPSSRSADSTTGRFASASGTIGSRMPPPMRPSRASAHLTGIGLGSTNSFRCSGSSRLFSARALEQVGGAGQVAGGVLDADDPRHLRQPQRGLGRQVGHRAARHVVQDDRQVDRLGHLAEVLVQPFLRRLVVVRHDLQRGVGSCRRCRR